MSTSQVFKFEESQIGEAKAFYLFYVDLIHSFNNKGKYFLSDDVVLDYFGQTIKGRKNVTNFIKGNILTVGHLFEDVNPCKKIGFRDTHIIKLPKVLKRTAFSPFCFSPPKKSAPKTPTKTKTNQASTSSKNLEIGSRSNSMISPAKRRRLLRLGEGDFNTSTIEEEILEIENELEPPEVKYLTTEGFVEFHRPSLKKLQTETKWQRPCKLSIAYSCLDSNFTQDTNIYLIIYEGNVRCRRNLMRDFSSEEPEN